MINFVETSFLVYSLLAEVLVDARYFKIVTPAKDTPLQGSNVARKRSSEVFVVC